jgi:xylulokinase
MQLANVTTGQWSPELCALAGIRPNQLSVLRPSGAMIGPVTPEVSRLTGLSRNTVVINGGHDHSCEALAMGLTGAGKALLTCGTAWVITSIVDTPAVASVPDGMDLNVHVLPDRWTVSQLLGSFGAFIESWLNQAWQHTDLQLPLDRATRYAAFNEALAETKPGSDGLLFIPGTAPFGGFFGLQLGHNRADMSRAVLEGPAFELRIALEQLHRAGLPIERFWLAGGATRSPLWPQILADVTGIPLVLTEYTHWAALGAAILAGVGAAVFESAETGQARLQKPVRHLAPNSTHRPVYDERFAAYQQIKEKLSEINLSER